ncbi:unnamed protein product, partial [marine sediment metagenome]
MTDYFNKARKRMQITQGGTLQDMAVPGKEASFMSQAEAKLVDDPATRVRILAENRFPNLPEKERLSRYRSMPNGEIAYREGDAWFRAMDDGLIGIGADIAGKMLPIAGSVIGSRGG